MADATAAGVMTVRVGYRPPFRFAELLSFFRDRALAGVELVGETSYARTVRMRGPDGEAVEGWLRVEDEPARSQLVVTMPDSLAPCMPQVVARVRRLFDADCDPAAVTGGLAGLDNVVPGALVSGARLPGCFDAFETACRAVLGQQITVAAASKLAARIARELGHKIDTGISGLALAWPPPSDIAALETPEETLGELGVIRSRSRTIATMAQLLEAGELDFGPGAVVDEQMRRLLAVKGIGPWTANYIAMRVLGHPDAFLESDSGVAHALPGLSPAQRVALAEEWRPWRSYAVVSLWNSLA